MVIKFVNMFLLQLDMPCKIHSVRELSIVKRFLVCCSPIRGINSFLSIDCERNLCFTLDLSSFDILLRFYALLKFCISSILSLGLSFE